MQNCHMKVLKTGEDDFDYTYLLEDGISIVKGGVKVLMDMNYPQEIIDSANKTASN
jgi:DNA mismatch repair ATPase MutS